MTRLFLLFGLLLGSTAFGSSIKLDKERTIYMVGDIDGRTASTVIPKLLKLSEKKEPVYLVISSNGGSLAAGEIIIDVINSLKHQGVTVNCLVPGWAFSMAFNIFANCSNRYAFSNSKLLFHPARLTSASRLSSDKLAKIKRDIDRAEQPLIDFLLSVMKMDKKLFLRHYKEETRWRASELAKVVDKNFLTVVKSVEGLKRFF